MCSIDTVVNNIVCLRVVKRVDVKSISTLWDDGYVN